ncbi:MAG: sugar ABC transporter ATP-binding protein [Acidimicrobiales bacterium]
MTVVPQPVATLPQVGTEAVTVRDVCKSFGATAALRNCSFTAHSGEIHAVVGENGSGKSTLAKVLGGVLAPDSGVVEIVGLTPTSPVSAQKIGVAVVFQEILLADNASVLDNLYLGQDGLFRAKTSRRNKRTDAAELLNRLVGTRVDLDQEVQALTLNVRQWIVIARALLRKPKVIVFDESTAALDYESVERFFEEARRLRDEGVCVLIVTHRISELTGFCDRATVLQDGTNVGTLKGEEIVEKRLLELMSSKTVVEANEEPEPPVTGSRIAQETSEERLTVSGLKLSSKARPIDLAFRTGEIVGLAGLEGQGQVKFIRAVTGITRPASGRIQVRRQTSAQTIGSARSADRAGIAYVTGDRKAEAVFPNLSVLENFGILGYRRGARFGFINRRQVKDTYNHQVEDLSIRVGRASASINSLSGGNQQKIVIGRALAATPVILALNDPTRGVDIGAKHYLHELLRRLAEQGMTVLFLSNEIEEFIGLCDRVVVFREDAVFDTLVDEQIRGETILAAMFGYAEQSAKPDDPVQ